MRRNLAILSAAVFSLLLAAGPADAQPLTNTLTSEQVFCNETQLASLLSRTSLQGVNDPQNNLSLNLLVSYSNPFGFFEGLAVANQSPFTANAPGGNTRAESFLAFSINPSIRRTLLNPSRQPLEQVSLVREDTSTNLVGANASNALAVFLNPTLGGNDNTNPGRLEINNIGETTAAQCGLRRGSDIKPGRGLTLAGLTTACHTQFTEFDRMVFEILQRTVRVQSPTNAGQDFEVAIFRGEEELTYRIDVYPVGTTGANSGRVALELTLTQDGSGGIQSGTLRLLPSCTSGLQTGCTTSSVALNVFLVAPVFGGSQIRLTSDVGAQLSYQPGATAPAPATVDFGQLLEGTPWNN